MKAHAHLKLVVSQPERDEPEDSTGDRMSMVQPISSLRLRVHRLRAHAGLLLLWSASLLLMCTAAFMLARRL